jgi:hypothetical protein
MSRESRQTGQMKFITSISRLLICFAFLFAIAEIARAKTPENDHLAVLVDGTVVPLVRSYSAATNQGPFFDVVIIENSTLRNKLSEKYIKLNKWLKFEPKDGVVFKVSKGGGIYIHKATGQAVYVNTFDVIASKENKNSVRWVRIISGLGGFTKIVTMFISDNKWTIVDVKLETVS